MSGRPARWHRVTGHALWAGLLMSVVLGVLCSPNVLQAAPPPPEVTPEVTPEAAPEVPEPRSYQAPLADPVLRADVLCKGTRVQVWDEGDASAQARFLLLDGDASFEMGVYRFRAARAVVRIDTERAPGRVIRHYAVYLDQVSRAAGQRGVAAEATRLLVTASSTGNVAVETDLFTPLDAAPSDALVDAAASRVARHRLAQARPIHDFSLPGEPYDPEADPVRQARHAQIAEANRISSSVALAEPVEPAPPRETGAQPPVEEPPTEPERSPGILPTRGVVRMRADRGPIYQMPKDGQQPYIALVGNVVVLYEDFEHDRQMSLRADSIVIFLKQSPEGGPDAALGGEMSADAVEGVYLEDNAMITDGHYTVRAPRAYYDTATNRAVLLEAVMYTYDLEHDVPLYMRAGMLRQNSASSFEARDARLTTSEFAEPHFAIGASRVTVNNVGATATGRRPRASINHATARWYDTPIFYWPHVEGDITNVSPLRRASVGTDNNGVRVETAWDLFALSGSQAPDGVELLGNIDVRGEHGGGVGLDLNYDLDQYFGQTTGYLLPYDTGADEIGDRADIDFDGETRGFLHFQHRHDLPEGVELTLEAAYISDETFLEEFFPSEAHSAKEYETSFYFKKQENEWALDLWTRYDITNFTPQLTTLQTPGYTVDRGPELRYFRTGTDLFDGLLTWYTENRVGQVRINAGSDTPADRGFSNADSLTYFGIPNTTRFKDAIAAIGLEDQWIARIDTRHEIALPTQLGPVDVTPYVVGRATGYDDDFAAFSGEDDPYRLFGGGGVRTSTEFHKTYSDLELGLFDVHGIRHIVEPHADLFWYGATLDNGDLPVYDPEVEGISEGGGVRVGATNTFQTKRGGPGRWRNVDWLRVTTDLVFREDEGGNTTAVLPRFYDYRPEYALGGDHFYSDLAWMVTDAMGFSGDVTYSFESDQIEQWRSGLTVRQSPRLTYFASYGEIDALDSRLLSYGFDYQLTTKYDLGFTHNIDFETGQSRSLEVTLDRKLPRWQLRTLLAYDEIDDETVLGIIILPAGLNIDANPFRVLSTN